MHSEATALELTLPGSAALTADHDACLLGRVTTIRTGGIILIPTAPGRTASQAR